MALVAMAVWDTEENGRTAFTRQTLRSLADTVDWSRHRLIVVDNGSCKATHDLYHVAADWFEDFAVYFNHANVGTARAVNRAWKDRVAGEHAVKMDNDVVIHDPGWLDRLCECVDRDPALGIVGLKRKDLAEHPFAADPNYRSELRFLPRKGLERHLVVERVRHVMGTCQLYSSRLLDRIGYLYQLGGLYGYDDCLAAVRCRVAGFYSAFYPHTEIDHVDPGTTPYQQWKHDRSGEMTAAFDRVAAEYNAGTRPVYHGPEDV